MVTRKSAISENNTEILISWQVFTQKSKYNRYNGNLYILDIYLWLIFYFKGNGICGYVSK